MAIERVNSYSLVVNGDHRPGINKVDLLKADTKPVKAGSFIMDSRYPPLRDSYSGDTSVDDRTVIIDEINFPNESGELAESKPTSVMRPNLLDAVKLVFSPQKQREWIEGVLVRQYNKGRISLQVAFKHYSDAKTLNANLIPVDFAMGVLFSQPGNVLFGLSVGVSALNVFGLNLNFIDPVTAYAGAYGIRMLYTIPRSISELRFIYDKYLTEGPKTVKKELRRNTLLFSLIEMVDVLPFGASYISKIFVTKDRNGSLAGIIADQFLPKKLIRGS